MSQSTSWRTDLRLLAGLEPRSKGRNARRRNKTPELIKLTALYCVAVFGRWSSYCRFYGPATPKPASLRWLRLS